MRRKFQLAEEEKQRKLQAYSAQKPMCERDTEYHSTTQRLIDDKYRLAEQEKQKKLAAYRTIAEKEHSSDGGRTSSRVSTTSCRNPGDVAVLLRLVFCLFAPCQQPGWALNTNSQLLSSVTTTVAGT